MKIINFGYDKEFNLPLQFQVFIEPYTQKSLVFYHLETLPVPI